ncbi:sugar transferase [Parerythrobacter aurantius]|uniref:sugar transferase n=1 Tax=Parerythrobacter aurantius TaxID=3127706 RepID=UPI00324F6FB2
MGQLGTRLIALVLLVLALPLMLTIALASALTQGHPVVFTQDRAGIRTVPFRLIKFRSMRDVRDSDGNLLPDAQRVTRFGSFLRRTRLDEIPGLINVARGEMAFVGPRPLLPETIKGLGALGAERCEVRPGLTGWSQVNGNTLLSLQQKVALDLWYIRNRSWLLDARIIGMTFVVMIAGERMGAGRV